MFNIANNQTITFFPTRAAAQALAAINAQDDEGTEYRVTENAAGKFIVVLYDGEDFLGTL